MSAADLVWIATASLQREKPERRGFSHDEIRQRVYALEPAPGFSDSTIRTHIATHCVANKQPDPSKHRKLYLNPDASYRLYRVGDPYDRARRQGKIIPDPNRIPPKYHDLLDWYRSQYAAPKNKPDVDPILALRGVGKELWREVGGGDKFIRELRSNWYGNEVPERRLKSRMPMKRKRPA